MEISAEKYYDELSESYDSSFENILQMKIENDLAWSFIKKFLPKSLDARVLDAGGGTGRFAIPIAKLGYHVSLVDIS